MVGLCQKLCILTRLTGGSDRETVRLHTHLHTSVWLMAHCSISISCIGQSGQKEWLKTFKTHLKRAISVYSYASPTARHWRTTSVTAHKTCRSTPNRQTHVNWCRELELERVWWVWCLQTEPTCEHLFPKSSLDVELISAFWARKQFTSKKTSRLDVTSRETCDFLVKQK